MPTRSGLRPRTRGTGIALEAPRPARIVLHCPEITLKGRNQGEFQQRLRDNVVHRLRGAGLPWRVRPARGRLYVDIPSDAGDAVTAALAALAEVPGVDTLAAARWLRPSLTGQHGDAPDWDLVEAAVVAAAREAYRPDATFAVRVNRVDKRLATTSQTLERRLGDAVRRDTDWERVRLKHPDRTFHVDVYPDGMYCYADKRPGPGGLPVGASGRVLALLSGGIDSPVAAYLAAKRGCAVDFLHLSASAAPGPDAAGSVVARLAARVSRYSLRSRLWLAPYVHFDLALPGDRTGYELVLFRRFMARVAERLARRIGAQALVTGDSLGQVASQTLENLVSGSRSVSLPLLRPLLGFNKQEIIELSRRIGTYETSIEPYKDCCALLSRKPRTRSRHEDLEALERELLPDYEGLLDRTLADAARLELDSGRVAAAAGARAL